MACEDEKVRGGQNRHGDAYIGQLLGNLLLIFGWQACHLCCVPHRNLAAELIFLRQFCNEMQIEAGRIMAGVDVHVDVYVELTSELEDPVDLPRMIGVVIGGRAYHTGTAFETFHQRGIGARGRGEPFLRKDADFEVGSPGILLCEYLERFHTLDTNWRIDLGVRANARRALLDAVLERLLRARINILHREGRLYRLNALHMIRRTSTRLRRTAVDDARLIEMDVGLDQSAAAEASLGIVGGHL